MSNDDTLKTYKLQYEELPFASSEITKAHVKAARAHKDKTTASKR